MRPLQPSAPPPVERRTPAAAPAMPQRQAPAPQVAPRQAFRVLQTSRAPAQLSLFLRPGTAG